MREHAELGDDELGATGARRSRKRSPRPSRAPRRAPGPIRTRSRMASTPAEEERRPAAALAPALPPVVLRPRARSRAPCSCAPSSGSRAIGSRERARAGRRRARADAPLLRRLAGRRRAAQAAALPRDGQVRAVPRARWSGARSPWAAGSPSAAPCRTWRPTRSRCACCATATCCSSSPRARAIATARRDRSWAPRGSRSRREWRSCPSRSRGSDRIKLLPPRFPKIRVHYGEPIPLDDLPADDLRRASYAATKRWSEAIDAGLASLAR